jgi:adenosylmethionine-8-amino-7-oxononanoate aminotransferase
MRAGQTGEMPIGDVICLAPPLIVSEAHVDQIVEILRESVLAAAG